MLRTITSPSPGILTAVHSANEESVSKADKSDKERYGEDYSVEQLRSRLLTVLVLDGVPATESRPNRSP